MLLRAILRHINNMERPLRAFRQLVFTARTRFLYPALAVGMGVSTMMAGVERSSYVSRAAEVQQATLPEIVNVKDEIASNVRLLVGSAPIVRCGDRACADRRLGPPSDDLDEGVSTSPLPGWTGTTTT